MQTCINKSKMNELLIVLILAQKKGGCVIFLFFCAYSKIFRFLRYLKLIFRFVWMNKNLEYIYKMNVHLSNVYGV